MRRADYVIGTVLKALPTWLVFICIENDYEN
jgi:hypothetical protein